MKWKVSTHLCKLFLPFNNLSVRKLFYSHVKNMCFKLKENTVILLCSLQNLSCFKNSNCLVFHSYFSELFKKRKVGELSWKSSKNVIMNDSRLFLSFRRQYSFGMYFCLPFSVEKKMIHSCAILETRNITHFGRQNYWNSLRGTPTKKVCAVLIFRTWKMKMDLFWEQRDPFLLKLGFIIPLFDFSV